MQINILKHFVVLMAITSNLYSMNDMNQNNNTITINCIPRDYSNEDININQLQEVQKELQDYNYIVYVNDGNKWGILNTNKQTFNLFSQSQISNAFNTLLTKILNKIKNTNNSNIKMKVATPFFRIIYQTQKLSCMLDTSNSNTLKIIDDIINEMTPLCKDHAVTCICTGQENVIYGLDKLNANLNTINEQFVSGLNFEIDFTKKVNYCKEDFKQYYIKILKTPSIGICLDTSFIPSLIKILDECDTNGGNTIKNLKDYFNKNKTCVENKIDSIMENIDDLFNKAWDTQWKKNDFNKLLQFFIKKIDNSKDLNKDNRIELFRTFFNNLFCSKCALHDILNINDIKLINKINDLLNRNDVKDSNLYKGFRLDLKKIWKQTCEYYDKGNIKQGYKLYFYYENILQSTDKIVNNTINKRIKEIMQNNSQINVSLKNTLLEYFQTLGNLFDEAKEKSDMFFANRQALVTMDFWK